MKNTTQAEGTSIPLILYRIRCRMRDGSTCVTRPFATQEEADRWRAEIAADRQVRAAAVFARQSTDLDPNPKIYDPDDDDEEDGFDVDYLRRTMVDRLLRRNDPLAERLIEALWVTLDTCNELLAEHNKKDPAGFCNCANCSDSEGIRYFIQFAEAAIYGPLFPWPANRRREAGRSRKEGDEQEARIWERDDVDRFPKSEDIKPAAGNANDLPRPRSAKPFRDS